MTESEAIDKLKNMRLFMQIEDNKNEHKFTEDDYKANEMAIQALEKQIAKKPYCISSINDNDNADVECPICHCETDYAINVIKKGHCWKCGQLLDWSDKESEETKL